MKNIMFLLLIIGALGYYANQKPKQSVTPQKVKKSNTYVLEAEPIIERKLFERSDVIDQVWPAFSQLTKVYDQSFEVVGKRRKKSSLFSFLSQEFKEFYGAKGVVQQNGYYVKDVKKPFSRQCVNGKTELHIKSPSSRVTYLDVKISCNNRPGFKALAFEIQPKSIKLEVLHKNNPYGHFGAVGEFSLIGVCHFFLEGSKKSAYEFQCENLGQSLTSAETLHMKTLTYNRSGGILVALEGVKYHLLNPIPQEKYELSVPQRGDVDLMVSYPNRNRGRNLNRGVVTHPAPPPPINPPQQANVISHNDKVEAGVLDEEEEDFEESEEEAGLEDDESQPVAEEDDEEPLEESESEPVQTAQLDQINNDVSSHSQQDNDSNQSQDWEETGLEDEPVNEAATPKEKSDPNQQPRFIPSVAGNPGTPVEQEENYYDEEEDDPVDANGNPIEPEGDEFLEEDLG